MNTNATAQDTVRESLRMEFARITTEQQIDILRAIEAIAPSPERNMVRHAIISLLEEAYPVAEDMDSWAMSTSTELTYAEALIGAVNTAIGKKA